MKHLLFLFFAAVLILTGCIQSEQDIFINPDGSGKIVMKNSMPLNVMGSLEGKEVIKEARKETADLLKKAEGIDAWKDVRYEISSDSTRLTIFATGYFKDVNILNSDALVFPISISKEKGGMKIRIQEDIDDNSNTKDPEAVKDSLLKTLSEEEIQNRMAEYRRSTKQFMGLMMMMFSDMKVSVNFHVPGRIENIETFSKENDNTFSLSLEGERIIQTAQKEIKNDSLVREAVLKGRTEYDFNQSAGPEEKAEMINKIFGGTEVPNAFVRSPLNNLFDFDREFAEAKKEWQEIQAEYNLDNIDNGSLQEK